MTLKTVLMLPLWLALVAHAAPTATRPLGELVTYPSYRASASADPRFESKLAFAVGGRIARIEVRIGETVREGQRLARLDDREYRIGADRARAQLALVRNQITLAESQLAQSEALARDKFLSNEALRIRRTELAVRRSERDAARQALAAAELDLERTALHAPFDAVVAERSASVGDFVSPGQSVLMLAATAEPEIRARIPVAQVAELEAAGQWTLVAAGLQVPVRLVRVSQLVDKAGQTREAVFAPLAPMPVGLAGEVRWQGRTPLLPPGYVQQRDGRFGVFVQPGAAPEFRPLTRAEAGRPVPVPADWPLDLPVVDEGRFQIGLEVPAAAEPRE